MVSRIILTTVLLMSLVPGHARAQVSQSGDAKRGHALFLMDGCYQCHGTVGQGGPGARMAPRPLPAAAIAAYIRDPSGEMPPFTSKVVNDADIRDIHAYLETIPEPPKVADIPELK